MGCYWHPLMDVEFVGWINARIARGEPIDDFPENAVENCPLYAEFCIDKALAEDCGGASLNSIGSVLSSRERCTSNS